MKILLMAFLLICTSVASAQPAEKAQATSDPLIGTWRGPWDVAGGRHSGDMEIEARMVDDANVQGRMKASYFNPRSTCSTAWETLSGTKKGDTFFARYDLGGGCGKVDVVFSIQGDVMSGTWANEHGRNGTFRLSKK